MFYSIGKRSFSSYYTPCSYTQNRPIWTPFWASLVSGLLFSTYTRNSMKQDIYYLETQLEIMKQDLKKIKEQTKQTPKL